MTEAEWLACDDPHTMLGVLHGKASERKLRLLVVACCRRVWDRLTDPRSRAAVEMAERFADSGASAAELVAAHGAAYVAVDDCVSHSPFSEDQAVAAHLCAAGNMDEAMQPYDPFPGDAALHAISYAIDGLLPDCERKQASLVRDVFGNPSREAALDPAWQTYTVLALARQMYESRDFGAMPILADALIDVGCTDEQILGHCRSAGPHTRGCWVIDLLLGKG